MKELKNRIFKIWAYTSSHSILILRSPLKYPDQEGYNESYIHNLDIEFSAVAYLDIPNIMEIIIINEIDSNIPLKLQYTKTKLGYKIFEIKSDGNTYYIAAGSYRIGKNKWISEDRVQNMNLEYDEIIATS